MLFLYLVTALSFCPRFLASRFTTRMTMAEILSSSFHRKELPSTCISLSSSGGREIFKEGLAQGTCETFLSISEAYQSQGEPAFCGIGSLCMSLNALLIDPGRVWKGNWRWFEDTMLDCCDPIDVMKEKGTTIDRLHCLANCNGATAQLMYASSTSIESFRADLIRVCSTNELETVLIAAYHRGTLGQTGSGHFSPIGGYNREKDLVLIMDVARFKYPPHWVSVTAMFQAMGEIDPAAGDTNTNTSPTHPFNTSLTQPFNTTPTHLFNTPLQHNLSTQPSPPPLPHLFNTK